MNWASSIGFGRYTAIVFISIDICYSLILFNYQIIDRYLLMVIDTLGYQYILHEPVCWNTTVYFYLIEPILERRNNCQTNITSKWRVNDVATAILFNIIPSPFAMKGEQDTQNVSHPAKGAHVTSHSDVTLSGQPPFDPCESFLDFFSRQAPEERYSNVQFAASAQCLFNVCNTFVWAQSKASPQRPKKSGREGYYLSCFIIIISIIVLNLYIIFSWIWTERDITFCPVL